MKYIYETNRIYGVDDSGRTLAEITFLQTAPGVYTIDHTIVDRSLQGQGIAGKLVQSAVEEIRRRGSKVNATCSYAVKWLQKHETNQSPSRREISIAGLTLNGRIIMPPIATRKCSDDGLVPAELCAYYRARAANPHVSMIITEHTYFTLQGKAGPGQMSLAEDRCIEGLKRLTDAIHAEGIPAFAQINHAGAAALTEITGMPSAAPSPLTLPVTPPMGDSIPQELTQDQIRQITAEFAAAAARARAAGYDGVEIHSAHAYLLNQFYSPLTNHRTDEYGGSLENRLRLHREVIRAVRDTVGAGYPIALRLGAIDDMPGGNTLPDAAKAGQILEQEGIDLLDISGGMCRYVREGHSEAGYFRDASQAVKSAVSIPVILTGGVKRLEEAEQLLQSGAADLIGVGRELMANPDWEG